MSELLKRIKADQLKARKDGDKFTATVLTTLLGEASPSGNQTVTDADVQKVATKFVKNLKQTLEHVAGSNAGDDVEKEINIIENYLPQQLTNEELNDIIADFVNGDPANMNMGKIMGHLSKNYKGQYDGKAASTLAKGYL